MVEKVIIKVLPKQIPDLEEPWPIFLLTKENIFSRGPNIDVSTFSPGFMLQMDFKFFNV